MLTKAMLITLRILVFRAGPEDFPYDQSPRLSLACMGFALVATAAFLSLRGSLPLAVLGAVLNIGMLALAMRATLAARKLQNRFQQAFNALLTTTSVLTLLTLPFFAQLLPVAQELAAKLAKNPDLAQQPDQLAPMVSGVAGSFMAFLLLGLWQLAVIGYVFYKAAGSLALFVLLGLLMLSLMLAGISGGGPAG
jgi:hypothetical protein